MCSPITSSPRTDRRKDHSQTPCGCLEPVTVLANRTPAEGVWTLPGLALEAQDADLEVRHGGVGVSTPVAPPGLTPTRKPSEFVSLAFTVPSCTAVQ